MGGICLVAGALAASVPLSAFTLAWTHSIEKIRWEEDYHVAGNRLVLDEARIRGAGAGMEPPPDARLEHGVWHYHPRLPPLERLRLTHSPYAGAYQICTGKRCQGFADFLPQLPEFAVVEVAPCGSGSTASCCGASTATGPR